MLSRYGADGKFGSETEEAVKAFQTAEGLEIDGIYGELTHAALMDAIGDDDANEAENPSSTSPDASGFPPRSLLRPMVARLIFAMAIIHPMAEFLW